MAYIQGAVANRTVYLTLADVPATGVLYTDIVVQIKKQGATSFTTKSLVSSDWVNLGGGGIYSLKFSAADTNTLGNFTFKITSVKFDNFVYDEFAIVGYIQGSPSVRTEYLTLVDVPATGVLYTDIVVQIKKQGATAFTTKSLVPSDWVNLGGGIYSLSFSSSDMDTLGDFTFTMSSAKFDNFVYDEFTVTPLVSSGSASARMRTAYLTLVDVPATGVSYTDVVAQIKKQGHTSFTTKVLSSSDWVNLGGGLYSISFSAGDMDTPGDFTYTLSGSEFDNFVYDEFTIPPISSGGGGGGSGGGGDSLSLPEQCIVTGNIATLSSLPPFAEPLKIVAYPSQFPAKYSNTILTADAVWTFADSLGNFSLGLVRKSIVIIEIKRTGIRAQITIPDNATANLMDLLPPFTVDYSL